MPRLAHAFLAASLAALAVPSASFAQTQPQPAQDAGAPTPEETPPDAAAPPAEPAAPEEPAPAPAPASSRAAPQADRKSVV